MIPKIQTTSQKRDSTLCITSHKPDPALVLLPSTVLSFKSVKPMQYIALGVSGLP